MIDISQWPICDILISFYSDGFPLEKTISYANLRTPYLVNDLEFQEILKDRRLVLAALSSIGVPCLQRVILNRAPRTVFSPAVVRVARRVVGNVDSLTTLSNNNRMISRDVLFVDGIEIEKPFVEKPVDAEDHNIYVYFHTSQGGGCRKLFRKVCIIFFF